MENIWTIFSMVKESNSLFFRYLQRTRVSFCSYISASGTIIEIMKATDMKVKSWIKSIRMTWEDKIVRRRSQSRKTMVRT